MARFLKQSTAFTFRVGPFVDSTDGVTAETALTIAQADIQISKAGGAYAQTSAAPTTTHDADGWYQCPLTATDTNTLGALTVQIVVAGALPVWEHFQVIPALVYDSLVLGTDALQVDTIQIGGTVQTANDVGADVDAILVDTAEIGAAGAGLTVLATAANLATVDTVVDAILVDTDATIPAQIAALNDPAAAAIADAVWDEAKAGHVGAGSFGEEVQAHALSTEIAALNDPSAGAIADAVWDEAQADHVGAGTFGEIATEIAAILADTGTDGVVLTAAERVAIADAILGRSIAGGADGGRDVRSTLRRIRNRVAVAAGTMTVYQEDDTTSAWTGAVTTTAGNPVSEVNPT